MNAIQKLAKPVFVIPLLTVLTTILYLSVLFAGTGPGFPLDDSWIHQTIARNIALYQEYTFNVHEPMSGSTAPLWTLILAVGYLIPGLYLPFTYALGVFLLAATAVAIYCLFLEFYPARKNLALAAAAFFLVEWRVAWMAFSGMETLMFALVCCLAFLFYARGRKSSTYANWAIAGLAGAAATFLRPEGALLFAVIFLHWLWKAPKEKQGSKAGPAPAAVLLAFAAATAVGYGYFNYLLTGTFLPTTYYAKSEAFREPLGLITTGRFILASIWVTILDQFILLAPGLLYGMYRIASRIVRRSESGGTETADLSLVLLPALWMAGLFVLYALRLPVTYHHGRYLMPMIPFLVIYGIQGTAVMLDALRRARMFKLVSVWQVVMVVAIVVMWGRGASIYAEDARLINDEQVTSALWLAKNVAPGTKVAAHDIGAIGYFTDNTVVDIAGLITPEAIPQLRDRASMLDFSRQQGAEYLVMFPDWYPELADRMEPQLVFRVHQQYVIDAGFQNMGIYRLGN